MKMADGENIRPLTESPDDLYQKFLDVEEGYLRELAIAKQHPLRDDLKNLCQTSALDLSNAFEDHTNEHLQILLNLREKTSLSELDASICLRHEIMLKEERNTWRLAKALYRDELLDPPNRDEQMFFEQGLSEKQIIANLYAMNDEIRKMQVVSDWLEANEADDMDYLDEEDKAEFYAEGPVAWENTFHAIRSRMNGTGADDVNEQVEISMDPDAPFRNKTSIVHADKEVEIRLFKHLFRFMRAGKLDEGQKLARRVGYYWLSGVLDGWELYSDPNIEEENIGLVAIDHPSNIRPIKGNKKRDIWKKTCFRSSRTQGLNSFEKAIFGALGGNLKSVLPVCNTWSDHAWARLKCSIDVKIEKALRDPNMMPQENRYQTEFPQEFYDNDFGLVDIFKSINVVSPFKEATIHQTVQKLLIYNDIDALLNQVVEWCKTLEYNNDLAVSYEALSPHFLRFFAHLVLFLIEVKQVCRNNDKGIEILKSYLSLLTRLEYIGPVAFYTGFLPRDDQIIAYAHLLSTINNIDERRHCLAIATVSKLDVDEITQTVVDMIIMENDTMSAFDNKPMQNNNHTIPTQEHTNNTSFTNHIDNNSTKTTARDRRKIESLDYLLLLESKNYLAILHQGNTLLRLFATQRKMDAVKETFLKLPDDLNHTVENQWRKTTQREVPIELRNNMRELEAFNVLLETQELLKEWSEWHHKKPEEPKKPTNMARFCDTLNFEKMVSQYHHDLTVWREQRELKTKYLTKKIYLMFNFEAGWMSDDDSDSVNEDERKKERSEQLQQLRKIYIPQMTSIWLNVLQLTEHYEECLTLSELLADDKLKLYKEFSKSQLCDFLDKMSEITKIMIRKTIQQSEAGQD